MSDSLQLIMVRRTVWRESYDELLRLFSALECPFSGIIKKGAPHLLLSKSGPVVSEGSALIVEEAMKDDPRPLYVLFLGPLTDLASAYLQEPRIAGRFTAIWIGGGTYPYGNAEFNLGNDVNAPVIGEIRWNIFRQS